MNVRNNKEKPNMQREIMVGIQFLTQESVMDLILKQLGSN